MTKREISVDEEMLLAKLKKVRKGKLTNVVIIGTEKDGGVTVTHELERNIAQLMGHLEAAKLIVADGFALGCGCTEYDKD